MEITLTNVQRIGLMTLLNRQPAKKIKQQQVSFEVLKKVELSEETYESCFTKEDPNKPRKLTSVADLVTGVDFEKAEIQVMLDLIETTDIGVSEVRWAGPLLKVLKAAE